MSPLFSLRLILEMTDFFETEIEVLTPWALKNAKQVTDADSYDITVTLKGKESTTTYTGVDALFENESYAYYQLSKPLRILDS
mgnify:FL=1